MSICLHIKITLVLEVGICLYIFFPLQYNIVFKQIFGLFCILL